MVRHIILWKVNELKNRPEALQRAKTGLAGLLEVLHPR